MVSKYSQFVQLTAVVSVFPFQDLKHGIFFSMKLNSASLSSLKISLKKCKPQDCPCRLCKVFVNGVASLSQLS